MPDIDTTDKNPNIEILKRSELESKMSEIVESAWKDLGLPEGAVMLSLPTGRRARGDKTIGKLRDAWAR